MTRKELEEIDGIYSLFNFGKYKGKTLLHVIDNDPQYIIWCINNIKDFNINDKLKVELLSQYNQHIRYHQEHYYKSLMKTYDINAIDAIILEDAEEI
jgi:uncharacterized protein (DUF3820 family)